MGPEVSAVKHIGIIGGSGPEATRLLEDMVFEIARRKYNTEGKLQGNPHLTVTYVPLLQDVSNDEELSQVINSLKGGADTLKAGGVEIMCLACNTHHLSIDQIRAHAKTPFISMIELVGEELKKYPGKKVAVIGTGYTLRDALYASPIKESGAELVDLGEDLTEKSHQIIGTALSGIRPEMVKDYALLVNEIVRENAGKVDVILLGCTEYSVLEHQRDKSVTFPDVKIIDPLKLLAEAIAEASYTK